MSKTLRRDKLWWWPKWDAPGEYGVYPEVKGVEGLKNRRDASCKPGCRLCQRGPRHKRERMKKIRREASVDIAERM